jgi:hypothetical protein
VTADGEIVDELNCVDFDPRTKEKNPYCCKNGFLFTKARVILIDLVQYNDEKELNLRDSSVDYDELQVSEETHYIP